MTFTEMDRTVTIAEQMKGDGGPVILVNTLVVPAEDADRMLVAWTRDAEVMKRQPGFISTQMHRGVAGSGVFLNYAVWESPAHFKAAFENPAFREAMGSYPPGATVTSLLPAPLHRATPPPGVPHPCRLPANTHPTTRTSSSSAPDPSA